MARGERKSPSESAKEFQVGDRRRGNDGNMWEIMEYTRKDGNAIKRWKKAPEVAGASSSEKARTRTDVGAKDGSGHIGSKKNKKEASGSKRGKKNAGSWKGEAQRKGKKTQKQRPNEGVLVVNGVPATSYTHGAMRCDENGCVYEICSTNGCKLWQIAK